MISDFFKKLISTEQRSEEIPDINEIIRQIESRESEQEIPLGRRIHTFSYKGLQLFLDQDITENYRVTIYSGRERIYSFSIYVNRGEYESLKDGYKQIIEYLDSERKVSELPENENIKGFFYGH